MYIYIYITFKNRIPMDQDVNAFSFFKKPGTKDVNALKPKQESIEIDEFL